MAIPKVSSKKELKKMEKTANTPNNSDTVSEISLKRAPLGPRESVCFMEVSALLKCPLYRKSTKKCLSRKLNSSCLYKRNDKRIGE